MNIGRLLIFGGMAAGGYWLYNRMNLDSQITIGTPRVHKLQGTTLILMLPVINISRVDVSFNGFLGYLYTKGTTEKVIGQAIMQTPQDGLTIAANSQTDLQVDVKLDLLAAGTTIIQMIDSGNWRNANLWLRGNYFIMGNIKMPLDMQLA